MSPSFALQPGERIKRRELHDVFGGGRQGGIAPSLKSPEIFLFTDPKSGKRHGYTDGWGDDGLFHYTGEGQRGDQQMKAGNQAILNHKKDERRLRLFDGSGGMVTYVGLFEISSTMPYYTTDAPETDSPNIRSVIVFRLVPLDAKPQSSERSMGLPEKTHVANVPIESLYTEKTVIDPSREPYEAERREAILVKQFVRFMEERGHPACRHMIHPEGEAKPLYTDIYFPSCNLLVEAKGTIERGAIRTAIGQLFDYRRFLPNPKLAVLLPMRPRADLVNLLLTSGVDIYWKTADGFSNLRHS